MSAHTVNRALFFLVTGLVMFGILMVYSTSGVLAAKQFESHTYFLARQGMWFMLGLAVLFALSWIPYEAFRSRAASWTLLALSATLLVWALFSPAVNATHRWISAGGFRFQPAEFAKWALVVILAAHLARKKDELGAARPYAAGSAVTALFAALIAMQPDFGSAALLVMTAGIVFFAAGMPWAYVMGFAGAAALSLGAVLFAAPYRVKRILSFLHPDADPAGAGFQVRQSLMAVGSGGTFGKGLGGSEQKQFFLPEPHTDFMYAVIAEEFGLIGALAVLAAFMALLVLGLMASRRAPDFFGKMLALGFTSAIVLQALLHIGVTLQLLPTKGLPLPFLSYGGSSLVMNCAAAGVILNVSSRTDD